MRAWGRLFPLIFVVSFIVPSSGSHAAGLKYERTIDLRHLEYHTFPGGVQSNGIPDTNVTLQAHSVEVGAPAQDSFLNNLGPLQTMYVTNNTMPFWASTECVPGMSPITVTVRIDLREATTGTVLTSTTSPEIVFPAAGGTKGFHWNYVSDTAPLLAISGGAEESAKLVGSC